MKRSVITVLILLAASLLLAAGLQAWIGAGAFLPGWFAAGLLTALGGVGLWAAWKLAGGGRQLAWIVALAFLLRLIFGAAMSQVLPAAGYAVPEQQAGY